MNSAFSGPDRTIVVVTLNAGPNLTYTIRFYAADIPDPSGYGGAKRSLGEVTLVADAKGHIAFRASLPAALGPGQNLTATATGGATSEFARDVTVAAATGSLAASVPADFDGDGKADLTVYRPTLDRWFILRSGLGPTALDFGAPGVDIPLAGDFDGDAVADLAVYRPSTGHWLIQRSTAGGEDLPFGAPNLDIPVPADYDGDGKTDLAVYRPTTGQWFIQRSTAGPEVISFGGPGDQQVAGDLDGDGKADVAVYRPSTGQWLILGSTSGPRAIQFGGPGDIPVPADYDGDGKTDLAVYRPSTSQWFIIGSSTGPRVAQFGGPGLDQPVPADYDGDGKADLAVYRRSIGQWLISGSSNGPRVVSFGQPNIDVPVVSPLAYRYQGGLHASITRAAGVTLPIAVSTTTLAAPASVPPTRRGHFVPAVLVRRRLIDAGYREGLRFQ